MRSQNRIVLVVGRGGREHALVRTLLQSPTVAQVYCQPGNGSEQTYSSHRIEEGDFEGLLAFCKKMDVDLVIVGPEAPLVDGLQDFLEANHVPCIGPNAFGAKLEGSKIYTKDVCLQYRIPTAAFLIPTDFEDACHIVAELGTPVVVKADGLCAGKGVVVAETEEEAFDFIRKLMVEKIFGTAGERLLLEEKLEGTECSIMWLCDGNEAVPLITAQDYKRAYDGDQGPNTGGMGAYAPMPEVSTDIVQQIRQEIVLPTLLAHLERGQVYRGILYTGLMLTVAGPKLIEYNVRFGDPEIQVILALLKSDLLELLIATCTLGGLSKLPLPEFREECAVSIALVAEGYPEKYEKGMLITDSGFDTPDSYLIHAGTRLVQSEPAGDELLVTDGGRVMYAVGVGNSFHQAHTRALKRANRVQFEGKRHRTDIALKLR